MFANDSARVPEWRHTIFKTPNEIDVTRIIAKQSKTNATIPVKCVFVSFSFVSLDDTFRFKFGDLLIFSESRLNLRDAFVPSRQQLSPPTKSAEFKRVQQRDEAVDKALNEQRKQLIQLFSDKDDLQNAFKCLKQSPENVFQNNCQIRTFDASSDNIDRYRIIINVFTAQITVNVKTDNMPEQLQCDLNAGDTLLVPPHFSVICDDKSALILIDNQQNDALPMQLSASQSIQFQGRLKTVLDVNTKSSQQQGLCTVCFSYCGHDDGVNCNTVCTLCDALDHVADDCPSRPNSTTIHAGTTSFLNLSIGPMSNI